MLVLGKSHSCSPCTFKSLPKQLKEGKVVMLAFWMTTLDRVLSVYYQTNL